MGVNKIALSLFFMALFGSLMAQEGQRFNELKQAMDSAHVYDGIKMRNIQRIKDSMELLDEDQYRLRFGLQQQMFDQYKIFKSDSAYQYALRMRDLSIKLGDRALKQKAFINLADICIAVGMYKEALDFLGQIDIEGLAREDRSMYYGLYGRCYGDLAEYSNLPSFSKMYNQYARENREMAQPEVSGGGFFDQFMLAFNQYEAGELEVAKTDLEGLLEGKLDLRDQALTHYVLGEIHQLQGNVEKAEVHYLGAALADIRTSTKESLAIIRLSELLFKERELELASKLIEKAYADAHFYGAQQRKLQVGAILPLIGDAIISNVEKERNRLYWQYLGAIGLIVALGFLIAIILFQYKRLQKTRSIISASHSKLKETHEKLLSANLELKARNEEIVEINGRLMEANKIKEEYLGFFFTEYDNVFEKFNDLTSEIENDLALGEYERASYRLSRYDPKKEKGKLLSNFDTAFINLFPNFINEFNALMKEGHQVKLKKDQILNKELRIYALLRLGVRHNEKIAQILGYSVNSVYMYKSKVRNNSVINNTAFDRKLIENTTISP